MDDSNINVINAEIHDAAIQQTDQDASSSRMSAVNLGYLQDPFAKYLCASTDGSLPIRRYPIMNRGTYVRTTALDRMITLFLDSGSTAHRPPTKQIISLGAGTDTRFFRLASSYSNILYHELDFPKVTKTKIDIIQKTPCMSELLPPSHTVIDTTVDNQNTSALYSTTLNIHPIDLRTLSSSLHNIDPTLPTLILSECCLTYLSPTITQSVISTISTSWLNKNTEVGILCYDPIRPNDAFGQTMVRNLRSRGVEMPGLISDYARDLDGMRRRMRDFGFCQESQSCQKEVGEAGERREDITGVGARSVEEIYSAITSSTFTPFITSTASGQLNKGDQRIEMEGDRKVRSGEEEEEEEEEEKSTTPRNMTDLTNIINNSTFDTNKEKMRHEEWISISERQRIEKLEWLDEVEEWKLLAAHYCISWGWKGESFTNAWGHVAGHRRDDEERY